jgi:serine phosphatase RsbU (regulator of sigma subunit)
LNPTRRLAFGLSTISFVLYYFAGFVGISNFILFYDLLLPFSFGTMLLLLLVELLEKSDVKREIDLAREIQLSLLPPTELIKENLEIYSFANTAREVGGDYVDMIETEEGTYIIIADVSGKGLTAALYMVRMQALVHLLIEKDRPSPKELLVEVNDYVKSGAADKTCVTACAAFFPQGASLFQFARAGHHAPIFFSKERDATFDLRSDGFALGMTTTPNLENHLLEKKFHFKPGDSVLFYSDGLVEVHDPQRDMFGFPRLQGLVGAHRSDGSALVNFLLPELARFTGEEWEQEDDITLVTLDRSETA